MVTLLPALPSLKKLPSLLRIGDSPLDQRYTKDLAKNWKVLIRRFANMFAIPRKLEAEDIEQELYVTLWKLTERVDPINQPDDFRRMAKAELRNRCVDLTRHYRAHKRSAVVAQGLLCECGNVTTVSVADADPACDSCGAVGIRGEDTDKLRWVDIQSGDVSLSPEDSDEDDGDSDVRRSSLSPAMFIDGNAHEPYDGVMLKEIIRKLTARLEPNPDQYLLHCLLNPDQDLVDLLLINGCKADPRKAPRWLIADYLDISEADLRLAYTRLAVELASLLGRQDYVDTYISSYNLRQLGFFS